MPTSFPSTALHQLAGLNALDWLLVLVILWSATIALLRGLVRELFGLAGTVLGLLLACWNHAALAARLSPWISSPIAAAVVAFLSIALGTLLAITLLGRLVQGTARTLGLGLLDRLAGAVFGSLRGALLALGIVVAVTSLLPPQTLTENSRLAPYFLAAAREVSFVVPRDLQQQISGSIGAFRHIAHR